MNPGDICISEALRGLLWPIGAGAGGIILFLFRLSQTAQAAQTQFWREQFYALKPVAVTGKEALHELAEQRSTP